MIRRPSRLKLAWHIYAFAGALAALTFWGAAGLGIIDKPSDAPPIVIGLGLSVVMVAGSWSELRRLLRKAG